MRRPHFEITSHDNGKSAFVHTRVELYYRDFLEDLDVGYNNDEDLFSAHVKAPIWGFLYIEGLLNYKLRTFTQTRLDDHSDLADRYWQLTKQAKVQEKLDLILSIERRVEAPWVSGAKKKFRQMVDERNRLVHFKDAPTPFDLSDVVAKVGPNAGSAAWSEHTPKPRIVGDLLSTPLRERLDHFRMLGDAIEAIPTG